MSENGRVLVMPYHLDNLRTSDQQDRYERDQADHRNRPLELEPAVEIFEHWRIIEAEYPYDAIFSTHHLLLPKETDGVRHLSDVQPFRCFELFKLLDGYIAEHYDVYMANTPKGRSVPHIYHLHLGVYHKATI